VIGAGVSVPEAPDSFGMSSSCGELAGSGLLVDIVVGGGVPVAAAFSTLVLLVLMAGFGATAVVSKRGSAWEAGVSGVLISKA